MLRYSIDNEKISVACCRNCGNEVGIKDRLELTHSENVSEKVTGSDGDGVNILRLLDFIMDCCKNRDYSFWRGGEWIN